MVRPFRDLPLFAKGLVVVAIPLLWLLAITVSFYFIQRENESAQAWVNHTLEVRSQIQSVHSRVDQAETGVLGYLLTREPAWLTPYNNARRTLPVVLHRLETMVGDRPDQLAAVREVESLVSSDLKSMQALPGRIPAQPGVHPALAQSRDALNQVHTILDEMQRTEDGLLAERRAHAEAVWGWGYDVIAAGILFVPAGAIVAMLLFTSAVARRIQVLEHNSRRLARGLPISAMRSGGDEIGRLEQSVSEAASLLAKRQAELRQSRDELEARVFERTSELAGAKDKLADTNRQLQALIDASPLAIIRINVEGYVEGWSRAAEQMFGWRADEVIGRPLPIIPDGELQSFQKLLEMEARGEPLTAFELRRKRKDGSHIDCRIWTALLRNPSGEVAEIVGVIVDYTERKLLEQQLIQAQKMEAIGRVAGGVAHDFNNVLTVISGYGHMLRDGLPADSPLQDAAEEVLRAADRAAALAMQLLVFSRRQAIQPKVLDLNELVHDFQRMLGRVIGEDIEMITALTPGIGSVRADAGQIEQVLMNLVVNARDAMPGGGKITIETSERYLDEGYSRTHPGVAPGAYIVLQISDTGLGMDAEVKAHLFEPFFTTKERGKGTGLGLSTVYGIVKQHGGDIEVNSEPGHGAAFRIYLPRAAAAAGAVPRPGQTAPPKAVAGERILLVEDEEGVRKLVRGILESHGYRILEAESAEAALAIAGDLDRAIDMLITDIVMPKMSGRDLAEALTILRPGVKVLFLSGYADRISAEERAGKDGADLLQKPFAPDELARKVREVLDRHSRAV